MENKGSKFKQIVNLEYKFPNRYFLLAVLPVNHDFDMGRVRLFPPDGFVDCLEVGRYLVGNSILSLRRQVAGGLFTVTVVTGSTTPGSPWSASTQRPYSSNSYRSYVFAYDLAGLDLLIRDDVPFCEHNIKFMTSGFVYKTFPNCIVADTPSDLRRKIQGSIEYPFQLVGTVKTYKFCYPLMCSSYFELYSKGRTIYFNTGLDNRWRIIPPSTDISDQRYWSNDFIYSLNCNVPLDASSGSDSNVTTSDGSVGVATNCTWGQLAEWLASGMGLCLRPDNIVVNSVHVSVGHLEAPVANGHYVRAFGSNEWCIPTVEYIVDSLG